MKRYRLIYFLVFILSICLMGFTWQTRDSYVNEQAEKKVAVGDIEIAYNVFGEGYPLILIMGYTGTKDMWDTEVVDMLSKHYKVITFDNRGMGDTSTGSKKFTIEQMADDTAGFIDAIGIEKAHVLGWSMGTNIALELVLRHPNKVNKLILYAADCGGEEAVQPSPEVWEKLTDTSGSEQERDEGLLSLMFPADWLEDNPDPRKYFPEITERSSVESINKQTEAMEIWQGAYSRLPLIKQSTLLITGTEDVLTPPENSKIILNRIPSSWFVRIKDGGHGVMYQYPDKFGRAVLTFLF